MKRILILCTTLLFCPSSWALQPEDVVRSSLAHVPQVLEAVQKITEAENKLTAAEGSFDAKLKGEADLRTEGYYSGDFYKAEIEKPFQTLNTKIYGGFRQSYGSFPVYDQKMETLSEGETFLGASVSLLRDAFIDLRRYKIRSLEQEQLRAGFNLERIKIELQTAALKAYWTWVVKGYEQQVYKSILELSQTRAKQLGRRIRAGDLAKIYRYENTQYIQKWRAAYLKSHMEFLQASYYLSIFNRGANGAPISVNESSLPSIADMKLSQTTNVNLLFQTAKNRNLEIQDLLAQRKQAELDVRLGRNSLLPKVDLAAEWSQDSGTGPTRLTQDDNRIMLKVDVPIQYRKGLGMKRAGEAKIEQVKAKQAWVSDKLRAQIESLAMKINSYAQIFEATKTQEQMAKKLADAERRKFSQGASDLILVNIREEGLARAQVKNLSSLLNYFYTDADLKNSQVQFVTR